MASTKGGVAWPRCKSLPAELRPRQSKYADWGTSCASRDAIPTQEGGVGLRVMTLAARLLPSRERRKLGAWLFQNLSLNFERT